MTPEHGWSTAGARLEHGWYRHVSTGFVCIMYDFNTGQTTFQPGLTLGVK